jgi:CRP-like cAMP-binding protein
MSSIQVALRSGAVFDLPERIRSLLLVAGLAGVVVIVVASLVSGRPGVVRVDKLLHFGGYMTIAAIFTLALRAALYVPALASLVSLGFVIELLQPRTGRERDVVDELANIAGIAVGACVGLLVRRVYGYIRQELAVLEVRRRLVRFEPGETIMREGETLGEFCIIKQGTVRLSRLVDGREVPLATAGPGDAIGILAVVHGAEQYATVTAETPTVIYGMDLDELFEAAGGLEQPVAVMLRSMATKLREAADELSRLAPSFAERDGVARASDFGRAAER